MGCLFIIKEGRRHRYIGFEISSTEKTVIDKSEMINALILQCQSLFNKDCKDMKIFLIRFNENKGIVRCKHTEKENTIKLLKSIDKISTSKVEIKTVGTSGTIKALIRKHMSN